MKPNYACEETTGVGRGLVERNTACCTNATTSTDCFGPPHFGGQSKLDGLASVTLLNTCSVGIKIQRVQDVNINLFDDQNSESRDNSHWSIL